MKAGSVYARLGWSVVPLHSAAGGVCSCAKGSGCPSAGKHPRIPNWQNEASSDPSVLADWIARYPNANVGIATGAPSGIVVLDVDGADGAASLAALVAKHGALPLTAEQRTGSGGTHYVFALPKGRAVPNSASKVGAGLDIRGDGGQIVAAPSVSAKGAYRWVRPPWETPPAPAPEWLLELATRQAPRVAAPEIVPVEFPPASPEVLDDAALALAEHGPAIEGQGGDEHTFIAAAMLRQDFALTETEAWPLLLEWNTTCRPPWSESDLAAKLYGGAKYGTRTYGCRRQADVPAQLQAMIAAFHSEGRGLAGTQALLDATRPLFAAVSDDTIRHLLEVELATAIGAPKTKLKLPPPLKDTRAPAGSIMLSPEVHALADAAVEAISPHVFARGGVLCEVVRAGRTIVADLEPARIVDLMSAHAQWVRPSKDGVERVPPPPPIAGIVHARRQHPESIRILDAVTTAPVFLADGSILSERGYNAVARVFLEPSVEVDVPDEPTRDDARRAVLLFKDLLCDYTFASSADFSAWLAGLLSPLVKAATRNAPTPLVCVSASSAGAGKSMLVEIPARIITGEPAEVRPYNPKDPAEWGKRITAFVRAGAPISVFDNVNGPFGDETIDRLVTSTTWSDRVLGASEAPPIPISTTWWATGNNIEPQGDTVRRVLPVRIDVRVERPQERSDFKRADLIGDVVERRSELLTAALTILRAYHVAGRPAQRLPAWGSFAAWSALIRGALVWTGLTDPFATQARAQRELTEPDNDAHDFWIAVVNGCDGTPASVSAAANLARANEVLGVRETITPYTLRKLVHRFVDRPRQGQRIRREGGRYWVEAMPEVKTRSKVVA